jgi:hypothetical protein
MTNQHRWPEDEKTKRAEGMATKRAAEEKVFVRKVRSKKSWTRDDAIKEGCKILREKESIHR